MSRPAPMHCGAATYRSAADELTRCIKSLDASREPDTSQTAQLFADGSSTPASRTSYICTRHMQSRDTHPSFVDPGNALQTAKKSKNQDRPSFGPANTSQLRLCASKDQRCRTGLQSLLPTLSCSPVRRLCPDSCVSSRAAWTVGSMAHQPVRPHLKVTLRLSNAWHLTAERRRAQPHAARICNRRSRCAADLCLQGDTPRPRRAAPRCEHAPADVLPPCTPAKHDCLRNAGFGTGRGSFSTSNEGPSPGVLLGVSIGLTAPLLLSISCWRCRKSWQKHFSEEGEGAAQQRQRLGDSSAAAAGTRGSAAAATHAGEPVATARSDGPGGGGGAEALPVDTGAATPSHQRPRVVEQPDGSMSIAWLDSARVNAVADTGSCVARSSATNACASASNSAAAYIERRGIAVQVDC
jgi:hypothetical protein